MVAEVRRFLSDEAGRTIRKWAVLTLIILAFAILTLILIGDELERIHILIGNELERFHDLIGNELERLYDTYFFCLPCAMDPSCTSCY